MKRFVLNSEPEADGTVRLEGKDYHYLVRVRRLAVGEFFPALLPDGEETLVRVASIDGVKGFLIGVCGRDRHQNVCPWGSKGETQIILFQALPKGDKMDLIVRQAAECGISEIVPFVSEFSFGKASVGGQKLLRWERIIKEARQQSGSKVATVLHSPLTGKELFDYWQKIRDNNALGLLFHHDGNFCFKSKNVNDSDEMRREGLEQKSLHGYLKRNPKIVVLVIGPEGGFSDTEVSVFLENGFKLLTIGDTVLRTETAALYCAASIRIILLERDSWELKRQD